jgi:NAD(P)-dependent dehydrogenase (short-subunit alcohol dehydrogenase family)
MSAAEDCSASRRAIKRFGAVDALLNNAALRPNKPFLEMTEAECAALHLVDLDAAVWLARACLPAWCRRAGAASSTSPHERESMASPAVNPCRSPSTACGA